MKLVECRTPTPYPFKTQKEEEKIRAKILKTLKKIRDSYRSTMKQKSSKSKKVKLRI